MKIDFYKLNTDLETTMTYYAKCRSNMIIYSCDLAPMTLVLDPNTAKSFFELKIKFLALVVRKLSLNRELDKDLNEKFPYTVSAHADSNDICENLEKETWA